jgi:hypothetical protein
MPPIGLVSGGYIPRSVSACRDFLEVMYGEVAQSRKPGYDWDDGRERMEKASRVALRALGGPTSDIQVERLRVWLAHTVEALLRYPGDPGLTARAERTCSALEGIQAEREKWAAEARIDAPGERAGPDETPPVVCSQTALSAHLGYKPGYTKLIERLKRDGVIKRSEQISPHKFRVWFTDRAEHERALRHFAKT